MLYRLAFCCLMLLSATGVCTAAPAVEAAASALSGPALSLTIYDDFALVRDRRTFTLVAGEQSLLFPSISAGIQPETALLTGAGLQVLEQVFAYDILTPQSLLERFVGREVEVMAIHPVTGERRFEKAMLLSVSGGVVVRIGDRIATVPPDRIVLPSLPPSLRDRPTLSILVSSDDAGKRSLQLSYLTDGLSWQADYVAELAPDSTRLDLGAWVTLRNESGADYRQARVQLVAGEVHRESGGGGRELMLKSQARAMAAAPAVRREKLFGYHLYSLPRPVTLLRKEHKQVALLQANGVACRRELVLRGRGDYYSTRVGEIGARQGVAEVLVLKNSEDAGLGMPLPAGTVRVYSRDSAGGLQFVGEDRMAHIPEGGEVHLALGTSFDVTARRTQVDFKKLSGFSPYNYVYESGYRITVNNAGETARTVQVEEQIPGDWTILEESLPHVRTDSRTASWSVQVPAEGSSVLTYRVRVKY